MGASRSGARRGAHGALAWTWLAVLLCACAPRPPAQHAALTGEDPVVNVYNWGEYIDTEVLGDFEREYGIHVNYDVYDSNEVLETKLLVGHTNFDVVVPSGYFLETQIRAGIYRRLDKGALPNFRNLDPEVVRQLALYDPGNLYAVAYMWLSTTGIAYNVAQIRARMPDAPLDSWRMMFDPQVLQRFQDCGIGMLDSPINVVSSALIYLGHDPNSESPVHLREAEQLLRSVRPYVRYTDNTRMAADLANGDICLGIDWSGDIPFARESAASNGIELAFSIPKEGAISNMDTLAIPADAPHPRNAELFINYLLRPEVAARNTTVVKYANAVAGSGAFMSEALRNDPVVYPPPEVRARLQPSRARSHGYMRLLIRAWTRFKAGH